MAEGSPIELDGKVLTTLEERLARHAPALLERLGPGLTPAEVDQTIAPLGIAVPRELHAWWGWRNGISSSEIGSDTERMLGYNRVLIPLEELVGKRLALEEGWRQRVGWFDWDPSWLLIGNASASIVCDCSRPEQPMAPVLLLDGMDEEAGRPRTRSLGQLVTWWIEAMDAGAWRYRGVRAGWHVEPNLLTPEQQRSWLV